MPQQKPGRSRQDFATPMKFIDAVQRRFGKLEWDLAAHAGNTRCGQRFFGPGSRHGEDSLAVDWAGFLPTGNLWLNPEFGDIGPWAKKCAEESRRRAGAILFLTPASIGSEWFAEYVEPHAHVIGLRPRLSFDGKSPFPKDLCLSVFASGLRGFSTWRWMP